MYETFDIEIRSNSIEIRSNTVESQDLNTSGALEVRFGAAACLGDSTEVCKKRDRICLSSWREICILL